jgi:hypothetical protein
VPFAAIHRTRSICFFAPKSSWIQALLFAADDVRLATHSVDSLPSTAWLAGKPAAELLAVTVAVSRAGAASFEHALVALVPLHVPAWHVEAGVHALWSSQAVPSGLEGAAEHAPLAGLQVPGS